LQHNEPVSVVFVTGGLGSGKSTFTKICEKLGAQVLDADKVVADLYRDDKEMVSALVEILGPDILDTDGLVDKKKVAAKIFSNSNLLHEVESIIHPRVRKVLEETAKRCDLLVYEIPIINASTNLDVADYVVVIDAPETLRIQRAIDRGMTKEDALSRISQQAKNSFIPAKAIQIKNVGNLEELEKNAMEFLNMVKYD
jgi:dephospho-CoA kinase